MKFTIFADDFRQYSQDMRIRDLICDEIQAYIRRFYPTAKLQLFGSTKNGFGLRDSDMDICLTFEDNPTGEVILSNFVKKYIIFCNGILVNPSISLI